MTLQQHQLNGAIVIMSLCLRVCVRKCVTYICVRACGCVCVCLTQHYLSITGAGFFSHTLLSIARLYCMCLHVCVCVFNAICTIANTALPSSNTYDGLSWQVHSIMLIFYKYSIIQLLQTKLGVYLNKLLWEDKKLAEHFYLDFRLS